MLANTLKYKCFDVDTMVELTHEKKPVAEIFKEFGQDYFRDCESQVSDTPHDQNQCPSARSPVTLACPGEGEWQAGLQA